MIEENSRLEQCRVTADDKQKKLGGEDGGQIHSFSANEVLTVFPCCFHRTRRPGS